jgi:hypothetical protein
MSWPRAAKIRNRGAGLGRGRRVGVEREADRCIEWLKQLMLVVLDVDLLHLGYIEAKKCAPLSRPGFGRMPSSASTSPF